jgi:hypothetical protein
LGDWLPHPIGGGALIHSGLVPVCLLNRNAGAFHGLLTRWQQIVLKQIREYINIGSKARCILVDIWTKMIETCTLKTFVLAFPDPANWQGDSSHFFALLINNVRTLNSKFIIITYIIWRYTNLELDTML